MELAAEVIASVEGVDADAAAVASVEGMAVDAAVVSAHARLSESDSVAKDARQTFESKRFFSRVILTIVFMINPDWYRFILGGLLNQF